MTTTELLAHLRSLEVDLWVEGDRLRFSAPKGVVTPELRAELSAHKAEILALLCQVQAPPIQPVLRNEVLPLSFAQQRLWFLHQVQPDSPAYNDFRIQQLIGPLDVPALNRSLNEIVRRHEVLRTIFAVQAEQPVQIITSAQPVPLPLIDLQSLPVDERETEAVRLANIEIHRTFDLQRGPLLRTVLLRLHPDVHVLVLTIHHIVTDGWSFSVLFQEMRTLYDAFSRGMPSPLAQMPIQYGDYAVWQRNWLQGAVLENLLAYWRQHLADLPTLQLPTDHPRPATLTHQGAILEFVLPPTLHARLAALSQQEGSTLFMSLLTAFQVLLAHYSGQTDIVVGTAVANRTRAETEGLIGFFVNQLVLRADLSGNPIFREALKRVREVCLNAYAHQELPFEELVKALNPERKINQAPLFQVQIVFENTPMPTMALRDLAVQSLGDQLPMARFDLVLAFQEEAHRLAGTIVYSTDLFDAATMTRLLGQYQTLLEGIATDPDRHLADLPLLTEAERRQLLVDWNATETAYPADHCFHTLVEVQAQRLPDAVAVVYGETQLSYRELNARSNQVAHYLQSLGVGPEVRVGLCLLRSPELVIGLLGILKAGGTYVPLDPTYPPERLQYMLADAQMSVVLTQQRLREQLPASEAHIIELDTQAGDIAQNSAEPIRNTVTPENLAYMIYTSGSTGRPKGAMIPHRGLVNYLSWAAQTYRIADGNGTPVHSPIGFDLTVTSLLAPLIVGQRVLLLPDDQGLDGLRTVLVPDAHLSLVKLTPAHVDLLNQMLPTDTLAGRAHALIIGGEALRAETIAAWHAYAPQTRLINEYGPTETVVGCCVYEVKPGGTVPSVIPIGRPIANTQLYILDRSLNPVPVGVWGELYIGGDGVGRGYLNRPDLTAEKFMPDCFSGQGGARLYRTGDRVRYLADGTIDFSGRIDQQVKLRGFRIELGEIEAVLSEHPAVREATVVVRDDARAASRHPDQRLVAYLVLNQGAQVPDWPTPVVPAASERQVDGENEGVTSIISDVRRFLQAKLPSYMVPSAFVLLESLPLTAHGKVDRQALPPPDMTSAAPVATFIAPRTPVEDLLAQIWSSVLRLERIGVHDNFFDLGGHSLLATQIISRVRDRFQVELTLRCFLEMPTIAEIAVTIENLIMDELEALPEEELDRLIQA